MCTFTVYYWRNQINEDEMGGICSVAYFILEAPVLNISWDPAVLILPHSA
jgi:hypothetical protein